MPPNGPTQLAAANSGVHVFFVSTGADMFVLESFWLTGTTKTPHPELDGKKNQTFSVGKIAELKQQGYTVLVRHE